MIDNVVVTSIRSSRGEQQVMKDIPVVFVHEGKQSYLKKTIGLAEKYNQNVYLIGNKDNKKYCSNWVDINSLDLERFAVFATNYKHMSTNSYQFELNCFRRFYLLYDFMRKKGLKNCMMLDSDLCTYLSYSEMEFAKYDVALSVQKEQEPYIWSASPHCSYWTIEAVDNFIAFFEHEYEADIETLEKKWNRHKEHAIGGGICDMTLLYLWIRQSSYKWLNLSQIYKNLVFDFSIGLDGNYEKGTFVKNSRQSIKKVVFKKQKPYFEMKDAAQTVCGATIHASGSNKRYIYCFAKCSNCNWDYRKADFIFELKRKIKSFLKQS